jgi:hypothetical protein
MGLASPAFGPGLRSFPSSAPWMRTLAPVSRKVAARPVIGVRVREHDRLDVLRPAPERLELPPKTRRERRQAGVDRRQSTLRLHEVPVDELRSHPVNGLHVGSLRLVARPDRHAAATGLRLEPGDEVAPLEALH